MNPLRVSTFRLLKLLKLQNLLQLEWLQFSSLEGPRLNVVI